jgi:hypothetical protein
VTRPPQARRSTLRLFELEPRDVPAGNVTVTQLGTELRVVGDAEVNTVTIRGHGPGVVEIQGIGTTINGSIARLTFSGVDSLQVDVAEGNDTVRTQGLILGGIFISGGSGDDDIQLENTSGADYGLYMSVIGDGGGPNGSDTITVTGTTVQGDFAVIYLQGDDFYDTVGGLDRITLANTRINVGYADIGIAPYGEYGLTEPGNIITVDNFDLTVDHSPNESGAYVTFQGGSGDDRFYLHNINVNFHHEKSVVAWVFVGSYEGNDTIDANNVHLSAITEATTGSSFEVFNQFFVSFWADTVRINNLDFVGGGRFYFTNYGGYSYTGGSVGITGRDVEVRNAHVHTNGFGGLGIDAGDEIYFGGPVHDRSWTVANVQVTSADGVEGGFYLNSGSGIDQITVTNTSCELFSAGTGDGNDSIRVTNSELGRVDINLGEGDDSLTFVNVAFDARHIVFPFSEYGGIDAGSGNDTVSLKNCTCEIMLLTMGDGDDTVNLTNCVFVTADLFGGDGTDELNLVHNSGLFNIDGFEI